MNVRASENRLGTRPGRRPVATVLGILLILGLTWGTSPVFGLWLPWASEKDKIVKTLNDIWDALLAGDAAGARKHLLGLGASRFIEQELARIKRLDVKDYKCRVGRVNIDKVSGIFAFVELEKAAVLKSGGELRDRSLRTLKKVDGEWKLMVHVRRGRKKNPVSGDAPLGVAGTRIIKGKATGSRGGATRGFSVNQPRQVRPRKR